jgi:hypothetical protein
VAICLDKLGRPAESSQVAIQAMHNMEQVWGKHHYRVSEARLYIANVLADSTRRSEALQQARTAYDIVLLPEWRTQKPDYLESAQVGYYGFCSEQVIWHRCCKSAATSICRQPSVIRDCV